ncbi:MAG: osmolarity response regulator [Methanoregula sp. PtaU1.Bin051]|nr:MAG: osmolarity response regulator [Methanoregula sp. PtaU1.Bin051]
MPARISILYVDDEPQLLELGRQFLEQKGEIVVSTAESVAGARDMLANKPFDVIVSDYQMPGTDGIEFLKFTRYQYPDIPFILFTGRGREEVVIEAINNGAEFYLQKGGDPLPQFTELAQKIRVAVDKYRAIRDLRKQTFVLEERVKELACLYKLAEVISPQGISLDEMLNTAVAVIPAGYQYPESTSARISFRGKEFSTPGFRQSVWNQNFPLFIDGEWVGAVEVSYTGEWSDAGNAPFLAEESSLLGGIVRLLENSIACRVADERLRDSCGIGPHPVPDTASPPLKSERDLRLAAEKDLRRSRESQELLLREVRQRVKNNLHTVHDLLALQSKYIRDDKVLKTLQESQNRIKAMALVHEILYQSPEITSVDLDLYVKTLAKSLFEFYRSKGKEIVLRTDISGVALGVNTAIPVGLIINELMSNALKHAFPERTTGEIFIRIRKKDRNISILFRDDGAGLPRDMNWRDTRSLGLRMVFSIVEQMKGTIGLDRSKGTEFSMVLEERK